jgi:Uncharacterised protein family (UPF0158)
LSVVVKLEAVIDAMELPDEWESFLDPDTGEILTMTDDDRSLLDAEEEDEEDLEMPDWQKEPVQKLRTLLDSGRALALPGKFDIHEWDLMRRFATSIEDPDESTELLGAVHGAGAFRLFKMTIARLGLRDRWFEYRDRALREMAREWLEAKGIEYIEEGEKGR